MIANGNFEVREKQKASTSTARRAAVWTGVLQQISAVQLLFHLSVMRSGSILDSRIFNYNMHETLSKRLPPPVFCAHCSLAP